MKFLVPNYNCLQNPWLRGYRPQIPVIYVLCPQLNLLNPPPEKNSWVRHWVDVWVSHRDEYWAGCGGEEPNYRGLTMSSLLLSADFINYPFQPKNKSLCKWQSFWFTIMIFSRSTLAGACDSVVVVGRSRDRFPVVSLDFSVTYFLPTVPWHWGRLSP